MPKLYIKPLDKDNNLISRAKTTYMTDDPNDPALREKVVAQIKRAGSRCARVEVDGSGPLEKLHLVFDRDAKEIKDKAADPFVQARYNKFVHKKNGPNDKCRKAILRQKYMDGVAKEEALAWALSVHLAASTFKTCWTEFRRLKYPRRGEK